MENRLNRKIPIVDEVKHITQDSRRKAKLLLRLPCQVHLSGCFSNPYGITTLLGLDAQKQKPLLPIAKVLWKEVQ